VPARRTSGLTSISGICQGNDSSYLREVIVIVATKRHVEIMFVACAHVKQYISQAHTIGCNLSL
jgi:hypothetical protein